MNLKKNVHIIFDLNKTLCTVNYVSDCAQIDKVGTTTKSLIACLTCYVR